MHHTTIFKRFCTFHEEDLEGGEEIERERRGGTPQDENDLIKAIMK